MDLFTLLKVLELVGPAIARAPEFVQLYNQARAALDPADQQAAREALAELQADNDEGHRRLQEKLAAAAARG